MGEELESRERLVRFKKEKKNESRKAEKSFQKRSKESIVSNPTIAFPKRYTEKLICNPRDIDLLSPSQAGVGLR